MRVTPPEPLSAGHDCSDFRNRHPDLVDWLQQRALANEQSRASRTFVVCVDGCVIGFYALAAGSVEAAGLPGAVRRNMPSPIPAIVLARLAVDERHQGRGIGSSLLGDALRRSLHAGAVVGARVLLCHAIDARARDFYVRNGFSPSAIDDLNLVMDLKKAAAFA